jgi:DNA repair exonuclease SbcCD nuclease subunit
MALRIFHTADLHLGMRFAGYPEVRGQLSEARYATLERLVDTANAEGCSLFVVAGDLFERQTLTKAEVTRAAHALNRFEGDAALVLPGNHDYVGPESQLWHWFKEAAGDRVVLLENQAVYDLSDYGVNAAVYAAPCEAKHSSTNRIGWIAERAKTSGDSARAATSGAAPSPAAPAPDAAAGQDPPVAIGVAHGSLEDVSPDFEARYFPMRHEELEAAGLTLWLLGHTHVPYPETPGRGHRIYNPGTPEPDGFDCGHEGRAFVIDIERPAEGGAHPPAEARAEPAEGDSGSRASPEAWVPTARVVSTGTHRFLERAFRLSEEEDIARMRSELLRACSRQTLLKLELSGRLSDEELPTLNEAVGELRDSVLYLEDDRSELGRKLTPELFGEQFSEDSFPYRLLMSLNEAGDERALQHAYELLTEEGQGN